MKKFYKENNQSLPAILFTDVIPSGFTEITNASEIRDLYIKQYKERKEDGENYYTETQAELYIDILNGVYTSVQVFEFEDHTSDLSKQIRTGNWLTAQSVVDALPISGIFDATKKAEIKSYIDDYVLLNY